MRTSSLVWILTLALGMLAGGASSTTQNAHAQSGDVALSEALRHVSADAYAERYVEPLAESAGAALSSGLFTRAPVNAGLIDGVVLDS